MSGRSHRRSKLLKRDKKPFATSKLHLNSIHHVVTYYRISPPHANIIKSHPPSGHRYTHEDTHEEYAGLIWEHFFASYCWIRFFDGYELERKKKDTQEADKLPGGSIYRGGRCRPTFAHSEGERKKKRKKDSAMQRSETLLMDTGKSIMGAMLRHYWRNRI
jgi:hypothetical protein